MKYIKILLVFALMLCLPACKSEQETIHIYMFYLDTCAHCSAFKKIAVPALEEEFGDDLEITYYDMDDEENDDVYDSFTDKLIGYHETTRSVPFIVVDGYFALLMYNEGEETLLISDIKAAMNGEEMSDYLSTGRWEFKEAYHA